jgi:hypothetical protein
LVRTQAEKLFALPAGLFTGHQSKSWRPTHLFESSIGGGGLKAFSGGIPQRLSPWVRLFEVHIELT